MSKEKSCCGPNCCSEESMSKLASLLRSLADGLENCCKDSEPKKQKK